MVTSLRKSSAISLLVLFLIQGGTVIAIEQPGYDVIENAGDIEIRRYAPRNIARTLVSGDFSEVGSQGFKRLAGYIFGNNSNSTKIAMTAPVVQQPVADNLTAGTGESGRSYWIVFVMPSDQAFSELPQPVDDRVELVQMPSQILAVLSYSGSWSEERYHQYEAKLIRALGSMTNWVTVGEPSWARYNAPITPWFLRDNEVAIEVAPKTQGILKQAGE